MAGAHLHKKDVVKIAQLCTRATLFVVASVVLVTLWRIAVHDSTEAGASRRQALEVAPGKEINPPDHEQAIIESPLYNDPIAKTLRLGKIKPEIISWNPRIIHFHNFLSEEEAQHMIDLGRPRLEKSTVVDVQTGQGIQSKVRTSSGMFLSMADRQNDVVVQAIEERISHFTYTPIPNGELLQILRYEKDQYYKPHHDYFSDEFNVKRGGQRVGTVLMYLSDVEEGGETIFPNAEISPGQPTCSCGEDPKPGLCVKPKKGNAILFWSKTLEGTVDPLSLHGGCPVVTGEKWSSTKWIRERAFV
eukprot:TRINITY_DN3824_c0_g1_i1.p1 TRINITY_DN3824_c0_g1~~TRINITY_DN3824_c0_g1_i1.p1  ORF type:complete len:324 (+),score=52.65 TRINITY_DN3824_c0_g1_i1:65-973(+)